jgi:hypothetical protein
MNHLKQAQHVLKSSPDSVASLGRMVAELESLYSVLDTGDDDWKARFYDHWGALEEVFAVALDRGLSELDEEGSRIVASALSDLRALVTEDFPSPDE